MLSLLWFNGFDVWFLAFLSRGPEFNSWCVHNLILKELISDMIITTNMCNVDH